MNIKRKISAASNRCSDFSPNRRWISADTTMANGPAATIGQYPMWRMEMSARTVVPNARPGYKISDFLPYHQHIARSPITIRARYTFTHPRLRLAYKDDHSAT